MKFRLIGKGFKPNKGRENEAVVTPDGEILALVERKTQFVPEFHPFLSPDFGANMNQNAAFGGTPEEVHDGTDNAQYTGSEIVGTKVTFDSTDQANTGTKSVKIDNPKLGDRWQFAKGSNLTVSSYVALTFSVYVDKDWSADESVEIYGYDTGTGLEVGSRVAIETYFNQFNFDVWQKAAIPLTDMGLVSGTIDALRMDMAAQNGGKNPKFYLDDIQFEQTGTAAIFKAITPFGTTFHVNELVIAIADNVASTVANGTMHGLAYDALLGVSALTNGFNFSRVQNGVSIFNATIKQMGDFLSTGWNIASAISNGTNTFITLVIEFPEPMILTGSPRNNFLSFTVNDDLSGLLQFTAVARGGLVI